MSLHVKLGRKARRFDPRIPHYSALISGKKLAAPPAEVHYAAKMPQNFGMMMNDTIGDCVAAEIGHARQVWTFNALNDERTTPDALVEELYEIVGGYVPGNPDTDQGCDIQTLLTYCLQKGAPIAPGAVNKLLAFVELDVRNLDDVKQAVFDCGIVDIGFNVPAYIMDGPGIPSVWDVNPSGDNTIVGGHSVGICGYAGNFDFITWGQLCTMTPAFIEAFVDEAYALADPGWISYSGRTPGSLSIEELEAAMQALTA